MFITSPEKFAAWFNEKYPGAYRRVTGDDIRELTTCGLICRYRYYSLSQDGETIRGILQYEQMREKRFEQEYREDKLEPPRCRICGQLLPPEPASKTGRPREYCFGCESFRNKERKKKSRRRRKKQYKPATK
jgi:hypothetical protein